MEVVLHLARYCIETAARKRYERLVQELLKEEDKDREKILEWELELLLDFLKKANFSELRKKGFDGSREMKVIIRKVGDRFDVHECR